jgi:hypothetical protein
MPKFFSVILGFIGAKIGFLTLFFIVLSLVSGSLALINVPSKNALAAPSCNAGFTWNGSNCVKIVSKVGVCPRGGIPQAGNCVPDPANNIWIDISAQRYNCFERLKSNNQITPFWDYEDQDVEFRYKGYALNEYCLDLSGDGRRDRGGVSNSIKAFDNDSDEYSLSQQPIQCDTLKIRASDLYQIPSFEEFTPNGFQRFAPEMTYQEYPMHYTSYKGQIMCASRMNVGESGINPKIRTITNDDLGVFYSELTGFTQTFHFGSSDDGEDKKILFVSKKSGNIADSYPITAVCPNDANYIDNGSNCILYQPATGNNLSLNDIVPNSGVCNPTNVMASDTQTITCVFDITPNQSGIAFKIADGEYFTGLIYNRDNEPLSHLQHNNSCKILNNNKLTCLGIKVSLNELGDPTKPLTTLGLKEVRLFHGGSLTGGFSPNYYTKVYVQVPTSETLANIDSFTSSSYNCGNSTIYTGEKLNCILFPSPTNNQYPLLYTDPNNPITANIQGLTTGGECKVNNYYTQNFYWKGNTTTANNFSLPSGYGIVQPEPRNVASNTPAINTFATYTRINSEVTNFTGWVISALADMNKDGKKDYILRNHSDGSIGYWLSDPIAGYFNGAGFVNPPILDTNVEIVGAGDMDNDGDADLVWSDSVSYKMGVYIMNGLDYQKSVDIDFFGSNPTSDNFSNTYLYPNGWKLSGTADFNKDGYEDIVWKNTSSSDLVYWLLKPNNITNTSNNGNLEGLGSSSFSNPSNIDLINYGIEGIGDLDKDGDFDFVARNYLTGRIKYIYTNPSLVLIEEQDFIDITNPDTNTRNTLNSAFRVEGLMDMNNDGSLDLITKVYGISYPILYCRDIPSTGLTIGVKNLELKQTGYTTKDVGDITILTNFTSNSDFDQDGIYDIYECNETGTDCPDTDADSIPDYKDIDSDNDGIRDNIEQKDIQGNNTGNTPTVYDNDGDTTPDYRDLNSDNDLMSDADEKGETCSSLESCTPQDTDNNNIPNYRQFQPVLGTPVATIASPITGVKGTAFPNINLTGGNIPNGTVATFSPSGSSAIISGTIQDGNFIPSSSSLIPMDANTGSQTGILRSNGAGDVNVPTSFSSPVQSSSSTSSLASSLQSSVVSSAGVNSAVNSTIISSLISSNISSQIASSIISSISNSSFIQSSSALSLNISSNSNQGSSQNSSTNSINQSNFSSLANSNSILERISINDPYICGGNIFGNVTVSNLNIVDRVEVRLILKNNSNVNYLFTLEIDQQGNYTLPIQSINPSGQFYVTEGLYTVSYAVFDNQGNSVNGQNYEADIKSIVNCSSNQSQSNGLNNTQSSITTNGPTATPRTGSNTLVISLMTLLLFSITYSFFKVSKKNDF